jgi:hypothetical protein
MHLTRTENGGSSKTAADACVTHENTTSVSNARGGGRHLPAVPHPNDAIVARCDHKTRCGEVAIRDRLTV